MAESGYRGLLLIGDPHLASRVPGFRRDDYPRVTLEKLRFSLAHARAERLLPAILGDLFHWPRDNANWLLARILGLLEGETLAIAGNHDSTENTLGEDDSLSVIAGSGRLRLLDRSGPWRGRLAGRECVVGGTPWGQKLPVSFDPGAEHPLVVWIAHHDVSFPGYEDQGWLRPREIPGVDLVVNGHIHRRLADVRAGATVWLNPGNISRVARGDASRAHVPSLLEIRPDGPSWRQETVTVPHAPFEEVFHREAVEAPVESAGSSFVAGLAELMARRTESGAGLKEFLARNLSALEEPVAREIERLSKEVFRGEPA